MATSEQSSIEAQYAQAEEELRRCQSKLLQLSRQLARPITQEYLFAGPENTRVSFSSLFGDQQDLIVIHNMGASCVYCTLWADEFNGALPHLQNRAAFVVISPDAPEAQQRFAQERGWKFPMVSSQGTTFKEDMGFQTAKGVMPGISTFHRHADGSITSVASDFFGPGDSYNSVWHVFDLLHDGVNGWEPQYRY